MSSKTLDDQIATLQKELQTQGATLSDAERAKRAKVIDDKQKQLKRSWQDAQGEFQPEMQETFTGVAGKVAEVLSPTRKSTVTRLSSMEAISRSRWCCTPPIRPISPRL